SGDIEGNETDDENTDNGLDTEDDQSTNNGIDTEDDEDLCSGKLKKLHTFTHVL
ncbi:hypothetical protein A2U01_0065024, partial [Trifolium medium]|nr:hypothetical protein [Trifolium medium]